MGVEAPHTYIPRRAAWVWKRRIIPTYPPKGAYHHLENKRPKRRQSGVPFDALAAAWPIPSLVSWALVRRRQRWRPLLRDCAMRRLVLLLLVITVGAREAARTAHTEHREQLDEIAARRSAARERQQQQQEQPLTAAAAAPSAADDAAAEARGIGRYSRIFLRRMRKVRTREMRRG